MFLLRSKIFPIRAFLITLLIGCSCLFDNSDVTAPASPVMVAHMADTMLVEIGIDAEPDNDCIMISWLAVTSKDLAGYRIYRYIINEQTGRRELGVLDSIVLDTTVAVNGIDTLHWLDQHVELSRMYYYYMRSYDTSENESNRSYTVHYKLIPKVATHYLESPRGDVSGTDLIFKVLQPSNTAIYRLILKVYEVKSGQVIWASSPFDPFGTKYIPYNNNNKATKLLALENNYRWRVDALGTSQNSGSESHWMDFYIKNDE